MAARSRRFSVVSTSSPRFRARIGRVDSRSCSMGSGNGLTFACIIAFLEYFVSYIGTLRSATGCLAASAPRPAGHSATICGPIEAENTGKAFMSEKPAAGGGAPTPVEAGIIGAGPVGLFQIFELGLLGISTHIIDSLAQAGGQCTELYPDKPIYDIPALPICGAQELIDRLLEQVKPFHATFHLGQEVTEVQALEDGKFHVATSAGTRLIAGAVVIAAGVGSFQPRRLGLPGGEEFGGRRVHYRA